MNIINKFTLIVLTSLSLYTLLGYFYIYQNTQTLTHQKYKKTSLEMKATLETLIQEKKEAILLISLTLSNNISIQKSLEKGDSTYLNLDAVTKNLRSNSTLKNVWFQVLTKDGTSFYRSWTDKQGDSLVKKRLDVAQIIQKPRVISSISTGKFDMTFKTMVPIYSDGKFIGVVETIARFNSIATKMQAAKNQTLILVDKAYKQQLTKALTQIFIHDYYVANLSPNQQLIEIFKKSDRQKILNLHNYILDYDNSLLLTTYQLLGLDDKPMGYFIISKKFSDVDMQEIWRSNKKIIFTLTTIAFIIAVFSYYIYIIKYQNHIKAQNKKLEKDVKERTKELNKSLELFGDHVIASESDINGKILYASHALCDISQYTEDELIGKPHSIFRHPDMDSSVYKNLWKTIQEGKSWTGEIKNLTKNGDYYWVLATILPNYDYEHNIVGYSSIRHDITSQKAKEEFMANMSHELRTPLNAIVGFSSLLTKKLIDTSYIQLSKQISSSSKSLLSLIDDILDLSKIQDSNFTIDPYKFNAYEELIEFSQLFEGLASTKSLHLSNNFNISLQATFFGDWNRIKQIILNLISNAVKFTPIDGNINTSIDYKDGCMIIIISDNGIGMNQKVQDKIFKPFVQADGSTTRKYGGTGLGLTITKILVELMDGKIELKSEEDVGSTFTVTLPFERLCDIAQDKEVQDAEVQDKDNTLSGHVLVVEDNKTNQMLIKMLLEDFGLTCDIANDGVEATEFYNPDKHALILMDENMPNRNGIEAMKIIRERYKDKCGAIIALTANAMVTDRERFLKAGMDEYISKPIDEDKLYKTLARFL